MTKTPVSCIILAAGKGTRMKSDMPKVLHLLVGQPMITHVIGSSQALSPKHTNIVLGSDMNTVKNAVEQLNAECNFVLQEHQLGTADAVKATKEALQNFDGHHIILYGDTPLITPETLQRMIERLEKDDKPVVVVLGMTLDNPSGYGRLLVNEHNMLERIIECKEANEKEKSINFCNSGVMAISNGLLFELLNEIENDNTKGEYYLTDIIGIAHKKNLTCAAIEADPEELMGVNSRSQLAEAEAIMQKRLRLKAMESGVTMIAPETVFLMEDTSFGRDVVIHPNVVFGPGVSVGNNVEIRSFSHIEGTDIAKCAIVGPFARLRPGTRVGKGARIGNFVEIKKSVLGTGAKVSHLSYIGDAEIGESANIGAGTITCNYDGFEKHKTTIGKMAFIGSNTALVAPVEIGDGAVVGAGSVITEDVEEETLSLARSRQKHVQNWAKEFRLKKTN